MSHKTGSRLFGKERFVERRALKPKSYEIAEYRCAVCDGGIRDGVIHRYGVGFEVFGLRFAVTAKENCYCSECTPPLLSEVST